MALQPLSSTFDSIQLATMRTAIDLLLLRDRPSLLTLMQLELSHR